MPYRDRLNSWAVIRLLPNLQRIVIARYRHESAAEGHYRVLQRLQAEAQFLVVFDPVSEERSNLVMNDAQIARARYESI